MDYKLISIQSVHVSGLKTKLTSSQKSNYSIIRDHWKKFNHSLRQKNFSLGKNWEKFGIALKENGGYFYLAGIPGTQIVNGFETFDIPAGKYVCFEHIGILDRLPATIYHIYKRIIPDSSLNIDKTRNFIHYEHYTRKFDWNSEKSIVTIYLPLKTGTDTLH